MLPLTGIEQRTSPQHRQRPHGRGGLTLACRLLPRDVRPDVERLYTVLRHLDDLVDGGDPRAAGRVAAARTWATDGRAASPETVLLQRLARRHPVPRRAVVDFCDGMDHDLEARRIETEGELDIYCYRVAGTVGILMTAMLGSRRPCSDAAAALGMAMQRTNILRDLDEDAARGRCYMAEETISRFGAPVPGRRAALVRDQIARADALYDRGIEGIDSLRSGRAAITAAAGSYREILRQIERTGHGERPGRTVVSTPRKIAAGVSLEARLRRLRPSGVRGLSSAPAGRAGALDAEGASWSPTP